VSVIESVQVFAMNEILKSQFVGDIILRVGYERTDEGGVLSSDGSWSRTTRGQRQAVGASRPALKQNKI
jgi:hypothetical protein